MLRHNPEYRRLKVGGHGAFGASSYWLGRDHLLVVMQSGYVENYRRFLFADMQALVTQKNRSRLLWNLAFGALSVPCVLSGVAVLQSAPGGGAFLLGLAFLFGTLGAVNSLKGPTCNCYLWTAVQQNPLPYLTRWRQAQRLLTELSPHILQAQERKESADASAPATTASAEPGGPAAGAAPRYVADEPNAPPRMVS